MSLFDPFVSFIQSSDWKSWVLIAMVPIFALTIVVEAWRFRRTGVYGLKDSAASLLLGAGYLIPEAAMQALVVVAMMGWVHEFRLMDIPTNAGTFALLYVLVDLLFYVYHRTSHRVRWFWATHVVHHASEHMNFTTAARQSTLYAVSGAFIFFAPAALLGFEIEWITFALALNLAGQWFLHTQWIRRLPRAIEFILNTPSHHRAHHGRNGDYIDCNFGGSLIIWDRLFGTFVPESDEEPPEFGIVRQVRSYNPVWLNLHEWADMFRDVARPGPLWLRLKHLWAPPEWQRPAKAGQAAQDEVVSRVGIEPTTT